MVADGVNSTDSESTHDGELPTWADVPEDVPAAIVEAKAAIRARIEAAGRTVDDVFGVIAELVAARTEEIQEANRVDGTAWPILEYRDIETGRVSPEQLEGIRQRGCVVIRGHFPRAQAVGWDQQIIEYTDSNDFQSQYRGAGDAFFTSVDSTPAILPIYWSKAQMEARQSHEMTEVQAFLNRLWTDSSGRRGFDPDRAMMYPDRIRRRPEGTTSRGLGYHLDAGTLDLWMKPAYQRAYRHVFDGTIEQFDPWDAAYRTEGSQFPGSTMTSVFRTFQGWTALSDMAHDQGVLHSIPIPEAIAYVLLRPLLDDVDPDDMCGVTISKTFPITSQWHSALLAAQSGIPDVSAGDSVWWHGDLVHGVAPVEHQRGWGNVMYIPAAPWCARNVSYAERLIPALRTGESPADFPEEHYEVGWNDRFGLEDLNERGRESLNIGPS